MVCYLMQMYLKCLIKFIIERYFLRVFSMGQELIDVRDKKMLRILGCETFPLRLQTVPFTTTIGTQNVYNGRHIYSGVKRYVYVHEKTDDNTWLINIFTRKREMLCTLNFIA